MTVNKNNYFGKVKGSDKLPFVLVLVKLYQCAKGSGSTPISRETRDFTSNSDGVRVGIWRDIR